MDDRITRHVRMVVDPCNAPIGPTAYRGQDGFVLRATTNYDHTASATHTCGIIAYWPRYNRVYLNSFVNDTTAFALDFYSGVGGAFNGPAAAYLGANAAEIRPIAACITSVYGGTELDRQGLWYRGVVPYRTVAGGTLTIAGLRQLLQKWERTPDRPSETKWIPGPESENYQAIPSTLPNVLGDDNIIVHAFALYGANKMLLNHRVTAVIEWQPFWGLGINAPVPNTNDPPAGLERVRTALTRFGNWWLEAMDTAATAGRVAGQVMGGVGTAARVMRRAAPLLITAG